MVRRVLLTAAFTFMIMVSPCAQAADPQALEQFLSPKTRLIVFSPHPDDETLGAGGLIQRVLRIGGKVRVIFMTDGDGYPEGVEKADHISHPIAEDYRKYGQERRDEALQVLAELGMKEEDIIFLGFPDGGLCYLLWKFRSDPETYTSPYTMETHPPASEMIIPQTDYNGLDLKREIVKVLVDFRPNLLAVTPPEDQHPDHCATYYFVKEALHDLHRQSPITEAKVLTFLIHFGQWPVSQGAGTGSRLNPPDGLPDKGAKWISLPLQSEEAKTKRKALLKYHTQMLVVGPYLMSFAKGNELFLMEHQGMAKEMEKIHCCWR